MRILAPLLATLLAVGVPIVGRAADPAEVLADAGLTRYGDNVWLLPGELALRKRLAELPDLREATTVLQRDLEQRIAQNRQTWLASQAAIAALTQTLNALPPGDPQRANIQQQIDVQRRAAVAPEQLAGVPEVREQIQKWIAARNALAVRLLDARETIPRLTSSYQQLAQRAEIEQAVEQSGPAHRLGPQKPLEPELRRLREFDRLAFTAWTPLYLQSGRVRFSIIANERSPLTVSWGDYSDRGLVLTATAAQSLDLATTEATRTIDAGKGRTVTAQAATVDSLRIGKWLLRDVPAWVLPPEAEDLGSSIDASALPALKVKLEPSQLHLSLEGSRPADKQR